MIIAIIVAIVVLVVGAIVFNAIQQNKERVEAEKRAEIAKLRSALEESETLLAAMSQLPFTKALFHILNKRVYFNLKQMYDINPSIAEIKQRLKDAEASADNPEMDEEAKTEESLKIPGNDKQTIQYIQLIKRLRVVIRSEFTKGRVESALYAKEDKLLERYQLRVNIETLAKRAQAALNANALGSARQYLEKAIGALSAQTGPSEYIKRRLGELQGELNQINENLRSANAEDTKRRAEEEKNDDLDELFAPKKKW